MKIRRLKHRQMRLSLDAPPRSEMHKWAKSVFIMGRIFLKAIQRCDEAFGRLALAVRTELERKAAEARGQIH